MRDRKIRAEFAAMERVTTGISDEFGVLRGEASAVRDFSKMVIAERGVDYGQVNFGPISIDAEAHSHAKRGHAQMGAASTKEKAR
jgi:hypothetical protein